MSKLNVFVNRLVDIINEQDRNTVKSVIGDSTLNNRTLTVTQFVRYLNATGRYNTAFNVTKVYGVLNKRLVAQRDRRNFRTDAFDINELLTVLTSVATRGALSTKSSLSKVIL